MSGRPSFLSPQICNRCRNPSIVNTVLHSVHQHTCISEGSSRISNIGGLITAHLKDVVDHGLPQIPSGVNQNLMKTLRVDHDIGLKKLMVEVSCICLQPALVYSYCI